MDYIGIGRKSGIMIDLIEQIIWWVGLVTCLGGGAFIAGWLVYKAVKVWKW